MDLNKRGFSTFMLITFIFVSLITLVVLGVVIYGFNIVDSTFSELDFTIANVSFQETYNQSLQPGIIAMRTTFPVLISTGVLLGMILVMMLIGYKIKRTNELWIILDIGIIIVAEIFASTISSSFKGIMNSSPELFNIFSTTLSIGSKYILNLPIIIPIAGGLIMLTTYLTNKQKEEKDPTEF